MSCTDWSPYQTGPGPGPYRPAKHRRSAAFPDLERKPLSHVTDASSFDQNVLHRLVAVPDGSRAGSVQAGQTSKERRLSRSRAKTPEPRNRRLFVRPKCPAPTGRRTRRVPGRVRTGRPNIEGAPTFPNPTARERPGVARSNRGPSRGEKNRDDDRARSARAGVLLATALSLSKVPTYESRTSEV